MCFVLDEHRHKPGLDGQRHPDGEHAGAVVLIATRELETRPPVGRRDGRAIDPPGPGDPEPLERGSPAERLDRARDERRRVCFSRSSVHRFRQPLTHGFTQDELRG
ncbi:MAG: hypothetical protein AB7I13_09645, partial [Vicinamibacterales bacterium]